MIKALLRVFKTAVSFVRRLFVRSPASRVEAIIFEAFYGVQDVVRTGLSEGESRGTSFSSQVAVSK